ncbi:MAG TPA: ATP-dependent DNA ligase [Candidatus Acidoferrales bacterium]|nr:ATP-dependent DNA ligase [Candidatus Acidoferrales bacterium]
MHRFAETCEAVAATTKKNEKVRLVGDYLRSLPLDDAAYAAVFFTGRAFPLFEENVLAVGGALIWQAVGRLTALDPDHMSQIYRKHGDLGSMVEEALQGRSAADGVSLTDLAAAFEEVSARRGPAEKLVVLEELLQRAEPMVAKYIVKIITGDLRIGLKESLVEEAIARAFGQPLEQVRRANMLTGDIGATLRLAAAKELAAAHLKLFHPIGFMLASPAETPAELFENFPAGMLVEDKYDGIRAQAHKRGQKVKLFSRTLDEIVEFPELLEPLGALPGEFILDGEVLAWRDARPLPFTELQKRLGRKQPEQWLLEKTPVRFVAFDLLYRDNELLLDAPLVERRKCLEQLLAGREEQHIGLAAVQRCGSAVEVQQSFEAALRRGNEGIMAKAPDSPYTTGRRGRFWLKLKQPLATLDVVVTAVEYGHGKRRGLLSDYTFAVRDADRLVNIGKAYSGLTDEEIRRFTGYFLQHTIEDQGFRRRVEPTVVLEVAFNNIQRSARHESGYALRFPRIVRLRTDKPADEVDTLERVKQLHDKQVAGRASES